jgi:cation:H+ antiporter
MPELATSAIAAFRRQTDVAVGNILGSNVYNILGIGGVTALIAPTVVPPEIVRFDAFVMLGVAAVLMVMMYTGRRISRGEGAVLLGCYAAYLWAIWPQAGPTGA